MKTEKLKQNVKGYVHQFEDGGLRLLRKGQKGVIHAIFSRFGLVLILLLLQVGLLFSIFRWFGNLWPHYFGGSVVVTSAMVIYLLNSKMDNSAKITWMVVVAIAPVVGIPMFFYVKSNFGHNILRKRLLELEDQLRGWLPQSQKAVEQLKALEPGAASLAKYLYGRGGGFPVYQNTAMTYFPGGEAKFRGTAAPAGNGRRIYLCGVFHHRRGPDVGQDPGGAGPQGAAGRGCPGDVRRHL